MKENAEMDDSAAVKPEPDLDWIKARLSTLGQRLNREFGPAAPETSELMEAIEVCYDYVEDPTSTAPLAFCQANLEKALGPFRPSDAAEVGNTLETVEQRLYRIVKANWLDHLLENAA